MSTPGISAVGADGPADITVQRWTKAGPVAGPLPPGDVLALQERQEVTVAEPAPLGLLGFAAGTIAIGYVLSGRTVLPLFGQA